MVVDLVLPGPEQSLLDSYQEWKEDAEQNACCDYAFRSERENNVQAKMFKFERWRKLRGKKWCTCRVAIPTWNDKVKEEVTELIKKEGVNTFKVRSTDVMHGEVLKNKIRLMDAPVCSCTCATRTACS